MSYEGPVQYTRAGTAGANLCCQTPASLITKELGIKALLSSLAEASPEALAHPHPRRAQGHCMAFLVMAFRRGALQPRPRGGRYSNCADVWQSN